MLEVASQTITGESLHRSICRSFINVRFFLIQRNRQGILPRNHRTPRCEKSRKRVNFGRTVRIFSRQYPDIPWTISMLKLLNYLVHLLNQHETTFQPVDLQPTRPCECSKHQALQLSLLGLLRPQCDPNNTAWWKDSFAQYLSPTSPDEVRSSSRGRSFSADFGKLETVEGKNTHFLAWIFWAKSVDQTSKKPTGPRYVVADGMAAASAAVNGADFVVSVGDNFYLRGVVDETDLNWRYMWLGHDIFLTLFWMCCF